MTNLWSSRPTLYSVTLLHLNVVVAIDFKCFDFFGSVNGPLRLARRYYDFLAVNGDAKWHRESFNHSFVVERHRLSVELVFE